jgi:hypothetical protein
MAALGGNNTFGTAMVDASNIDIILGGKTGTRIVVN